VLTTIIAAVDGSEPARRAAAFAGDLAGRYAARLLVVHVLTREPVPGELLGLAEAPAPAALAEDLPPPDPKDGATRAAVGERLLEEAAEAARARGAARVETLLLKGDPATVLIERAAQEAAELVVMGAKGLGALKGLLLGGVTQKVCQLAPCACLTVK
jgi:nucleotide-binding universal stress UspA family protein